MRPSAYSRTADRLLNAGFSLALAALALAVLSLEVRAIPPPLYVGLLVIGLGCMVSAEVLHLRTLEQYRSGAGYSRASFYSLVMSSWLRRTPRSLAPPLVLGLLVLALAVVWSFWAPTRPAVLVLAGAVALVLILAAVSRRLRR
jgi:hypothetical protein